MKKNILLLLLLVQTGLLFGQQQNMLPNFSPPSPEAFNMTKYGDVPIDEFNGKVKLDIPLYQFNAGKLSLPIAVNYYGAGVKVNDLPTQVGMNWSLEAGGVITREVRDIADEFGTRPDLSDANIMSLNQFDCTPAAGELRTLIAGGNSYDTEIDIFRFHFLNYSGSFYLVDSIAKMVKNDQHLRIEILGSLKTDKTFRITDPEGIQYYFGGAACEETYTRTISANEQLSPAGITAFYLYKIIHPVDGLIMMEYDSLPNYAIDLSKSYSLTKYLFSPDINLPDCVTAFNDQPGGSITKNNIHGNKLLRRIYNSNGSEIIFNRTIIDNESFKSYLNNIEIKKSSVLFSKIDFEYFGLENPTTASRFFLTKILINKDLQNSSDPNKKFEEYRMEYNNPESLPPRFSHNVDLLGYFNNKNNTTLIPCFQNQYGDYDGLCPNSNRTPDFMYASRGALSKIYYPTGGYTKFEYEPQPGIKSGISSFHGTTYINDDTDNQGLNRLHFEAPGTFVDDNGISHVFTMPTIGDYVHITIENHTEGNYENHNATVVLKIIDLSTTPNHISTFIEGDPFLWYNFDINHEYKIEFDMTPPTATMAGYSAYASFSFDFHSGSIPTVGAGVRLKRISNFANGEDTPEAIKRYYYKTYDKLNTYKADLFTFIPRNATSGYYRSCGDNGMVPIYSQTVYSDYIYSDYNCSAVKYKEYAHVTISYGGDDFEQGGIEKTFKISEETNYFEIAPLNPRMIGVFQTDFPNARNNSVSLDGLVLKEKIFKNSNGVLYKIKEKNYAYEYPFIESSNNLFAFSLFEILTGQNGCTNANTLSNYFIGGYRVNSFDYKKVSEKETTYLDPIPATLVQHEYEEGENPTIIYPTQEELEASYKKVTTTQNYQYGTLKGLPTIITTNSSETGITNIIKNYYANEAQAIGNLTGAQITACDTLVAQNKIATPIQVEQYQNTALLSKQRTNYKLLLQDTHSIAVPESIQTSKANNTLEDRVVFTEYDYNGNLVIVSLKDGMRIKYFYDSADKVIMKVENYTGGVNIETRPAAMTDCDYITTYFPMSMVTIYHYDPVTEQIIDIVSPNCQVTYYEYDEFHRLKFIRDNDHNIVQEYNNNYTH